jgi:hypothetical protein
MINVRTLSFLTLEVVLLLFISVPAGAEPKDDLIKALQAQSGASALRTTVVIQQGAVTTTQVVETVRPDRLHFKQTGGTTSFEFYVIGGAVYFPTGTTWSTMSVSAPPQVDLSAGLWQAIRDSFQTVSLLGNETVSGKTAAHYQVDIHMNDVQFATMGRSDIWVDSASGLPVKVQFAGSIGGAASQVQETLEFGPDFQINPPI